MEESNSNIITRHRKLIAAVFYLFLIGYVYQSPEVFHPSSVEDIQNWILGFGIWGPIVYVALYTIRPILLFPSLLLNLAAGILFTPIVGVLLLLCGGLSSATLLFFASRLGFGENLFVEHGGKWGLKIHNYLADEKKNFIRMLWLRTVPIFPYDAISLMTGCTTMSYKPYALATFLGMIPGAIAYVFLGKSLFDYSFMVATLVLLVAFGIPLLLWKITGEKDRM